MIHPNPKTLEERTMKNKMTSFFPTRHPSIQPAASKFKDYKQNRKADRVNRMHEDKLTMYSHLGMELAHSLQPEFHM